MKTCYNIIGKIFFYGQRDLCKHSPLAFIFKETVKKYISIPGIAKLVRKVP